MFSTVCVDKLFECFRLYYMNNSLANKNCVLLLAAVAAARGAGAVAVACTHDARTLPARRTSATAPISTRSRRSGPPAQVSHWHQQRGSTAQCRVHCLLINILPTEY